MRLIQTTEGAQEVEEVFALGQMFSHKCPMREKTIMTRLRHRLTGKRTPYSLTHMPTGLAFGYVPTKAWAEKAIRALEHEFSGFRQWTSMDPEIVATIPGLKTSVLLLLDYEPKNVKQAREWISRETTEHYVGGAK